MPGSCTRRACGDRRRGEAGAGVAVGEARQRTDSERLEAIETLLGAVLLELRARKRRTVTRARSVARRAEAEVRILPDPLTQQKAARILRRHTSR
jgi:hypothetical protein